MRLIFEYMKLIFLTDVVIGFEQLSYSVDEGIGQFDVCVVVIRPLDSQPLDRMFSLSVNTRPGTAGMSLKVAVHPSGLNTTSYKMCIFSTLNQFFCCSM